MTERIDVNVVAFQEGELWVAQCVEYDIAAFAKSLPELLTAFDRAIAANVCVNVDLGRVALDGIPEAPAHFREMFEHSQLDLKPRQTVKRADQSSPVRVRDLRVADPKAA